MIIYIGTNNIYTSFYSDIYKKKVLGEKSIIYVDDISYFSNPDVLHIFILEDLSNEKYLKLYDNFPDDIVVVLVSDNLELLEKIRDKYINSNHVIITDFSTSKFSDMYSINYLEEIYRFSVFIDCIERNNTDLHMFFHNAHSKSNFLFLFKLFLEMLLIALIIYSEGKSIAYFKKASPKKYHYYFLFKLANSCKNNISFEKIYNLYTSICYNKVHL